MLEIIFVSGGWAGKWDSSQASCDENELSQHTLSGNKEKTLKINIWKFYPRLSSEVLYFSQNSDQPSYVILIIIWYDVWRDITFRAF